MEFIGSSSSNPPDELAQKFAGLPEVLQTSIREQTMHAIALEDTLRYEAIMHRSLGDGAFFRSFIHPEFPFMTIMRPLKYSFSDPMLAHLRALLSIHTIAIKFEAPLLKHLLGLYGYVRIRQLIACANLIQFLEWFQMRLEWLDMICEYTGCIVIICSRKQEISPDGEVKYHAQIIERRVLMRSVYSKGRVYKNHREEILKRVWELNMGQGSWRSEWDARGTTLPWKQFPEGYAAKIRQNLEIWYLTLDLNEIILKWGKSKAVRLFERGYKRLQEFYAIPNLLPVGEPVPAVEMPTGV